jgi:hypothetical protein
MMQSWLLLAALVLPASLASGAADASAPQRRVSLPRVGASNRQQQQARMQLPPVDPESRLYDRMAGLIVPHGFPLEEHFVETVGEDACVCAGNDRRCVLARTSPAANVLLRLTGRRIHIEDVPDTARQSRAAAAATQGP